VSSTEHVGDSRLGCPAMAKPSAEYAIPYSVGFNPYEKWNPPRRSLDLTPIPQHFTIY